MRHSAINDLFKRSISLSISDGKRPDGMSIMPWKQSRCLVWDFTCPDSQAPSHLNIAVT